MKLYFSPGTCSLAPHIVLRESGLPFDLERVHLGSKTTENGLDFTTVNPKGYVPALQLDDGTVLTEGPAITQYIADQVPHKNLAPAAGSVARYQLIAWLNFISTEIHKGFSPLFNRDMPPDAKDLARTALARRIGFVADSLQHSTYLTGDTFTIADAYLFTVLTWTVPTKIELASWPAVVAFMQRVGARPAVQAALEAEGLAKKSA